jgi:hypothetical protein
MKTTKPKIEVEKAWRSMRRGGEWAVFQGAVTALIGPFIWGGGALVIAGITLICAYFLLKNNSRVAAGLLACLSIAGFAAEVYPVVHPHVVLGGIWTAYYIYVFCQTLAYHELIKEGSVKLAVNQ